VNGTLRAEQRASVETHLAGCAECRSELTSQTQVRDTIVREDVRQESAQASFDQLWERIVEDEAVAQAHAARGGAANAPVFTSSRPAAAGVMKWLVAAVIVEGIGLAALGAITWSNSRSLSAPPAYRTLSTPQTSAPAGQIRAVFSPDLRLGDLQSLLSTSRLSIVAGPTEAGVYTLTLEGTNGSVDSALARLRGNTSVRFAEPIAPPRLLSQ
jgi:anti-sigma factor RsiW